MTQSTQSTPLMASPSDLRYFLETASALNLSRAAERLRIAQPSLTQAMQRLEHAIGEPLFSRHKRGVTLTPAGKQLLLNTRALLQSWDDIKSNSVASMHEIQGRFTIGCHPCVALYALGSFLPKLLANESLQVDLVHDLSRYITERVINSTVDIGIVVNPVKHPDLIIHKLYHDEVSFWYLGARQKDLESYAKKATVIYDPNIIQSQVLLKKAAAAGIVIVRTMESSSLEVVASLTSANCGIGILPTRIANLAPKKLVKVPGAPIFRDEVCLITRVESKKVASIQYICGLIKVTTGS